MNLKTTLVENTSCEIASNANAKRTPCGVELAF